MFGSTLLLYEERGADEARVIAEDGLLDMQRVWRRHIARGLLERFLQVDGMVEVNGAADDHHVGVKVPEDV